MKKLKQFIVALAVAASVAAPVVSAQASSVSFSNFKFQGYAGTESFMKVTKRTKPDGEQRWYLTITKMSGALTGYQAPIAVSVKNFSQTTWAGPIHMTVGSHNQSYDSDLGIKKGTTCTLYMSGNGNAKSNSTVTVSGRYSS